MIIPRQPNWPNQSRLIFRANRDLRVAGGQRNEPILTRTILWSPWLCRGGESGWTESFGDVSRTTFVKIKIIRYPFFREAHCTISNVSTASIILPWRLCLRPPDPGTVGKLKISAFFHVLLFRGVTLTILLIKKRQSWAFVLRYSFWWNQRKDRCFAPLSESTLAIP